MFLINKAIFLNIYFVIALPVDTVHGILFVAKLVEVGIMCDHSFLLFLLKFLMHLPQYVLFYLFYNVNLIIVGILIKD